MANIERHKPDGIQLVELEVVEQNGRVVIGTKAGCDLLIEGDPTVSRVHCKLERVGPAWTVEDLGSSNGTIVNGERIFATLALHHSDVLLLGRTQLVFRDRASVPGEPTVKVVPKPRLTPTEQEVLNLLCRPIKQSKGFVAPLTAAEIAKERFTTESAAKQTLEHLYDKFGIIDGTNRRARLANEALLRGAVTLTTTD